MEQFATNLRSRAKDLGLAHAEVARRAGLTERRYGNYVAGTREPDLASLIRIAEALGTTPNQLLGVHAEAAEKSAQCVLRDRLVSAASGMAHSDLELLVIAAEAIALARHKADSQSGTKKPAVPKETSP